MFVVTFDYVSFQKTYEFQDWNDARRYAAITDGRIVAYKYKMEEPDFEKELDKIII